MAFILYLFYSDAKKSAPEARSSMEFIQSFFLESAPFLLFSFGRRSSVSLFLVLAWVSVLGIFGSLSWSSQSPLCSTV